MATKKKATKTKAIKKVEGFSRTDIIKDETGAIQLILQSYEMDDAVEFTISNMYQCISKYTYIPESVSKKEFIAMLETLADHILELKWHIEENV